MILTLQSSAKRPLLLTNQDTFLLARFVLGGAGEARLDTDLSLSQSAHSSLASPHS